MVNKIMKAVLVTGASRGIGRAIALELAKNDYAVGVNYRINEERANDVVKTIKNRGGKAVTIQADVANPKEVEEMIETFTKKFHEIYGLVNNAGIYKRKKFPKLTLEDWEETIRTNLTGTFLCTKYALPYIPNGGKIINFASVLAHSGSTQGAHYAASKAGVIGFSKSLAREVGARRITVNVIAPGATETAIIANDTPEKRKERERATPLGRVGKPEEIAYAVIFLLSNNAKYITGETMNVNGGLWMI
jgi:3-oxoacyl-[acyl-carrier protein] reductase